MLAIGISDYPFLPKLHYAHNDAEDLGNALSAQAGEDKLYRSSDTTILRNSDGSLARIRQALDQLVANTRPGDTLIVAISGHGLKKGQETYFAPARCDPENVEGTGLPWKEILAKLEEARKTAKAVWLLADCCRSAPGLRRDTLAATPRDLKQGFEEGGNLILCTASSGDTPSFESEELKHGLFTQAWLDALGGKAPLYQDVPRGRILTLSYLQADLDFSLRKYATAAAVRQKIEFPRLEGSFSPSQPVFVPIANR